MDEKEIWREVENADNEVELETQSTKEQLIALLKESARVEHKDDGAMTTRELRKITGMSLSRIRETMRDLIERGDIEPVKVMRMNVGKEQCKVQGYKFIMNDQIEETGDKNVS